MQKEKMTPSLVKEIVLDINNKLSRNHISNVTVINSTDIVLSFSFYRKEKLFISLNKTEPYIALLSDIASMPKMENGFSIKIREQIRDTFILSIEQINNDKIICLNLRVKDEEDYIDKKMYIELISRHPLIVVTDIDEKILFSTHYEDANRKILLHEKYLIPEQNFTYQSEDANLLNAYKYAEKLYQKGLNLRKNEKFAKLFNYLDHRKKTLDKKINVLHEEIKLGNQDLAYKDLGNACYVMEADDLKTYYADVGYKYDDTIDKNENAQFAFKKYKKAKSKISNATTQLEKAQEELEYINHLITQTKHADEDDLKQMNNEIFKSSQQIPKRKNKTEPSKFLPYHIHGDNYDIYFGKNDLQNDYLTFKVAKFNDTFLHIHNLPGAHVILKTNNPKKDQLELAAQIALYLSNQEDGDVAYTLVKDVKKGNKLGLVQLKKYQLIHMRSVDKKIKQLVESANKK